MRRRLRTLLSELWWALPRLGRAGEGHALSISTEAAYRSVFALAGVFLLPGAVFVLKVQETSRVPVAAIS